MTASRRKRPDLKRDEAAVSTVLGAILIFALMVVTLINVQVKFVPIWDKQRERDQSLKLAGQINTIQADLSRITSNQTSAPITDPLSLARPQGFTFFGGRSVSGQAAFSAAGAGSGMAVSSSQLTIQEQGGVPLYALSEQWISVGSGQTVSAVAAINHLRMRIVDPSSAVGTMTLVMTDPSSNCAGRLILDDSVQSGSDNNIEARVYGPATPPSASCSGTPISLEDWNEKKQLSPPYFYWDVFDSNSQFPAVIAAATYPLVLTLTLNGIQGDYTMAYDQATSGGVTHVGGGGRVIPNYNTQVATGGLSISVGNTRLPAQTYSMEYGALFLNQNDGTVMSSPPSFVVSSSGTQTKLQWSFAALSGASSALSSGSAGTLVASPGGTRTSFSAVAPDLTITVNTAFPALWRTYWDTALANAGLSSSSVTPGGTCTSGTAGPQYTITTTATSATLLLRGPCPSPTDTRDDISFVFQTAPISIELRPSG